MKAADLKEGDMIYLLDLTQCKVSVHLVKDVMKAIDKNPGWHKDFGTFQLSGIGTRKFPTMGKIINPTTKDMFGNVDCVITPYGSSKKYVVFTDKKLAQTVLVEYAYVLKVDRTSIEVEEIKQKYTETITKYENVLQKLEKEKNKLQKLNTK